MKANWKLALMCLATLTMVACNDKNVPEEQGTDVPEDYVSPINVKDQSVADWDALDPTKVAVAKVTADPYFPALKELRVYSDGVYINYMFKYDAEMYKSRIDVKDGMHVYMDIDNSNETGGFFDLFADAGADLMFEGALFEQGVPVPYAPTMHKWVGPEGGEPSSRVGEWEEVWEPMGSIKGESQNIGDSIVEGRLIVGLISKDFAPEGFGIGFDIQQNWNGIGLLPQLDAQGEEGELIGRTNMLFVPFDESEAE